MVDWHSKWGAYNFLSPLNYLNCTAISKACYTHPHPLQAQRSNGQNSRQHAGLNQVRQWFQVNNFLFSITIHCLASKFSPYQLNIIMKLPNFSRPWLMKIISPQLSRPLFTIFFFKDCTNLVHCPLDRRRELNKTSEKSTDLESHVHKLLYELAPHLWLAATTTRKPLLSLIHTSLLYTSIPKYIQRQPASTKHLCASPPPPPKDR